MNEFVNADPIAEGLSHFKPESVALAAGRVMLARLKDLARNREDFAFETTLASRSFAPWLEQLRNSTYRIHLAFLSLPSPELAIARVEARVRQGGHDVPEQTIRRRFKAGLVNFYTLYQAVVDSWQVFDNSDAAGPNLIASGRNTKTAEIVNHEAWQHLNAIAR